CGAMVVALGVTSPASAQIEHDTVVSENAADYTPSLVPVDGARRPEASALAVSEDTVYVGGRFGAVNDNNGNRVDREDLFALDRDTGELRSWAPQTNRRVWSLEVVGDSVYIGGQFQTVNGVRRTRLAKVDAVTGEVDQGFNARIRGGAVYEITYANGNLIISGAFNQNLLALDPETGADTGLIDLDIDGSYMNRQTKVEDFAVNPQGTRLVATGDFKTVEGEAQGRVFMANLNDTGATLSDWEYPYFENECASQSGRWRSYVQDVDFSPDGSYFAIVSAGYVAPTGTIGYAVCDAVARFETNNLSPTQPTWINYTGGDSLRSVAITGAAVYVQGHNRWLNNPLGRDSAGPGAVDARGGGAVDPDTGLALPWNPPHPMRIGGREIVAVDNGIWWGNDAVRWRGQQRRGLQFTPLP
ncbi:MAG: hypothetical protein L0H93_13035, partial [Nocardioides sp.]|nr:hypothetical protein [Nocardioides sp.]